MMNLKTLPTYEEVIEAKINCFKAGILDVLDLTKKQEHAMTILQDKTVKECLYGGSAGGGKSWLGCEWLLWNCLAYPGSRWFIGRKQLNEIRKSTIVTFRKVCKKHGIPKDRWSYNDVSVKITFANGSTIEGVEMQAKPGDIDFDRLGSTEYTGGWIEEAGGVPFKAYDTLKLRIGRHMNDEYGIPPKLYITCNPSRNWLYKRFYLPWKQRQLHRSLVFIQALILDNTKRESGYYAQLQATTGATRQRLLLGNWDYEDDPLALLEFEAMMDIYTNDYLRPEWERRRLICDIALHGSDLLRAGVFYGDVLMEHAVMPKSGGKQIVNLLKGMQAKHQIPGSKVLYDADAAGGFVGQEGGFIPRAIPFHGGARAFMRPNEKVSEFANLKTQCGYSLAEKINNGRAWARAVTREEDQEMLNEELLATVKRNKEDSDQKLRLIDKKLVKEAIGRSPDFADIWIMNEYFDLRAGIMRPPHGRTVNVY